MPAVGDLIAGCARRFLGQQRALDLVGQLELAPQAGAFRFLCLQPRILDSDGRLVGDAAQDAHPVWAEHVGVIYVIHQESADRLICQ